MNRQFDLVIIGDSKYGNEALKNIAGPKPTIKIAFISREFKSSTTRDFLNVDYIRDEVTYIDYKNRLFGCYLKSGERFYCTHLIVASGLSYAPLIVGNKQVPNVFNTTDEIDKQAKFLPAAVLGHTEADVKLALAVAKKYKQVYLCSKEISLNLSKSTQKKLNEATNIVVLPNASISKFTAQEGLLKTIELDNYTSFNCASIFVKTAATPETTFITDKIIKKDIEGYLEVAANLESTIVPKCFSLGNCISQKTTKKKITAMVETVLADF